MKFIARQAPERRKVAMMIAIFTLILSSCTQKSGESTDLPGSTPEAEGVTSASILSFLEAVPGSGQELHSFMYLRHGKVIAEGWWDPYAAELKHTLYSTSKSFTSTAIGFAVWEGLLNVDDKVVDFFPEYLPDSVSENLAAMTVKDLLTMSAGQDPEPTFARILPSDNWIKAFLAAPVPDRPGSKFLYNSSATYMLSAIITEVTGETVLEYLGPRLFDPLGIKGMDWEVDPAGINVGGWGLRLKTEDMAKFGQLFLQKGEWKGEQIVPEEWINEATSKHIDQQPQLTEEEKSESDWLQGYGYKFWRSRHNSYRADGAYGQYILVIPEKEVVIAITANARDMQKELNLVWDHLLPGMKDAPLPEEKETLGELNEKLTSLAIDPPDTGSSPELEEALSGKVFRYGEQQASEEFSFRFENERCFLTQQTAEGDEYDFTFGGGAWEIGETNRPGPNLLPQPDANLEEMLPFKVAGAYRWEDDQSLELILRYIESPHTIRRTYNFEGDTVRIRQGDRLIEATLK